MHGLGPQTASMQSLLPFHTCLPSAPEVLERSAPRRPLRFYIIKEISEVAVRPSDPGPTLFSVISARIS